MKTANKRIQKYWMYIWLNSMLYIVVNNNINCLTLYEDILMPIALILVCTQLLTKTFLTTHQTLFLTKSTLIYYLKHVLHWLNKLTALPLRCFHVDASGLQSEDAHVCHSFHRGKIFNSKWRHRKWLNRKWHNRKPKTAK